MATWNSNGAQTGGSTTVYTSGTQGVGTLHDNFAQNGDTITIPAGNFTWSGTITITKAITLQGAGWSGGANTSNSTYTTLTGTVLQNSIANQNPHWILGIITSTGGNTIVKNMAIIDFASQEINFVPPAHIFISDGPAGSGVPIFLNCYMENGAGGSVDQCVDHECIGGVYSGCTFYSNQNDHAAIRFKPITSQRQPWQSASTLGNKDSTGLKNAYVENCFFRDLYLQCLDNDQWARTVVRNNIFRNSATVTHGDTDQDIDGSGGRQFEFYNNTCIVDASGTGPSGKSYPIGLGSTNDKGMNYWHYSRGGVHIQTGNTFGAFPSQLGAKACWILTIQKLQRNSGSLACWSTNASLGPLGNVTPDYPAPYQPGWGSDGSTIPSNLNGTITVVGSGIHGYPNADGTLQSVRQVIDPCYSWNNTGTSPDGNNFTPQDYGTGQFDSCALRGSGLGGPSVSGYIQSGREFFNNTPSPTWVAFSFPHPLAGGTADTTPPTVPTSPSATATSSTAINLVWTASTDPDNTAAQITYHAEHMGGAFPAFVEFGSVTGSVGISDTGLTAGTTYTYRLRASDPAGNFSAYTATFIGSTPPAASNFPLKAGPTNRYLVDVNNNPYLLIGDSAWTLIGNVSVSNGDMANYFQNRKNAGFTFIFCSLFCGPSLGATAIGGSQQIFGRPDFRTAGTSPLGGPPADQATLPAIEAAIPPFNGGDISAANFSLIANPNLNYFSRVDSIINLAATYGLCIFLNPIENYDWINNGTSNGIYTNAFNSNPSLITNFGTFLGARYASFNNLVWCHGNDYQQWPTYDNVVNTLISAIRAQDSRHIHTFELNYNNSTSLDDAGEAGMELNGSYTYYPAYANGFHAYGQNKPVFLIETSYENESYGNVDSGTVQVVRRQQSWTLTCGAYCGYLYGSHITEGFQPGWQTTITQPAETMLSYLVTLLQANKWWLLSPDNQAHIFVITGFGTQTGYPGIIRGASPVIVGIVPGDTYCTGSVASDGTFGVVYCPATSTMNIGMNLMGGSTTATWMDPTNGAFQTVVGSPFPGGSGAPTHSFTTPGTNSAGFTDWVLILNSAASAPSFVDATVIIR